MINPGVQQYRVVTALVLRDARVRHGRAKLGYTWAIIEPVVQVVLLSLLFSAFQKSDGGSVPRAVFFSTGVLSFAAYRAVSAYVSVALVSNRPLFQYPPVKHFDAVLSRLILEGATQVLVTLVVFSVLIGAGIAPMPHHPGHSVLAFGTMLVFGFGVGMMLSVAQMKAKWVTNVYGIAMGAAFFLSGIFYSSQAVPQPYRSWLMWNPLIHGVEEFRKGYLAGYRAPDASLGYLAIWAVGSVLVGLAVLRLMRRRLQ